MVKSTLETLEDNRVKMSIEVEEATLDTAIDAAFKQVAKQVRLPGFRPGKVPRRVIESHFGKGIVRGQAIEEAVPDYFLEAAAEHEVDFIAAPEYDVTSGLDDGPLAFDAVVQVRPQINIGGYENLRVEIPSPAVTEDEIDERADQVRSQFGELEDVDRAAEPGDRVTIDINGTYNDEAVEGLTASDYLYEVGSGFVVSELDEHLEGASAGDSIEFDADHPDPDEDGQLSFEIEVKLVQAMVLPEVTDEFVKDATEFETVEAFRSDIESNLSTQKLQQANMALQEKTGEALGQLVEDEIPEQLVESEISNRINDMAYRLQSQGMDFGQYMQMTGTSMDDMREQMRDNCEASVKVDLALRALASAEGLEATDADIDEQFEGLAEQTGTDIDSVRERLVAANQMVTMRADIGKGKAGEWLMERIEIVDEDGNAIAREDLEIPDDHDHDHDGHDHDSGDQQPAAAHGDEEE